MLTIAEIARQLGLPEATARYYRDRYSAWIPVHGEGRSRRYPPAALDVIRAIAEMSRAGQPADMIEAELQRRGFALEARPEPQQQTAATQQQTAAVEALADVVRAAVAADLAPLRDELAAARNEIAQLRAAVLLAERRSLAPPLPPAKTQEPQLTAAEPQRPPSALDRLRRLLAR